jgi:hypothetical protein
VIGDKTEEQLEERVDEFGHDFEDSTFDDDDLEFDDPDVVVDDAGMLD